MNLLIRTNRFLENTMFLLIPSALFFGYTFHHWFEGGRILIYLLFGYLTFQTALNCSFEQFKILFRQPTLLGVSLGVIHILLPLFTLAAGTLVFPHDPYVVMGLVVASAIPIGVNAAVWTGITGGNNALALSLVVFDTLLSPIVLPLTIGLLFGVKGEVPLEKIVGELLVMVVLPSFVGLFLHRYRWWSPKSGFQAGLGASAKLALIVVVMINSALLHDSMASGWGHAIPILVTLVGLTIVHYLAGYLTGKWMKRRPGDVIALAYSSGMKNIALGVVFSVGYFDPLVSLPVIFFTLVQQPLAALVHRLLPHPGNSPAASPRSTL